MDLDGYTSAIRELFRVVVVLLSARITTRTIRHGFGNGRTFEYRGERTFLIHSCSRSLSIVVVLFGEERSPANSPYERQLTSPMEYSLFPRERRYACPFERNCF